MPETPDVIHDEAAHRFVIHLDGSHDAYLAYRTSGPVMDFYLTFVPSEFRGRGLAERLVKAGFEYAKANQRIVVPSCPYVGTTYLMRHPEYQPLVNN